MTKVKVNKNEYEYLETFGGAKNKALYYISRFGWNYDLFDGQGLPYNKNRKNWSDVFNNDFDIIHYKLIRAVLDGYELEEQKYTVEIPNPNSVCNHIVLLKQFGSIILSETDRQDWAEDIRCQLTETDIKQDFGWVFDKGFVKEVE